MKVLRGLLVFFWLGVSLVFIYFFWTGVLPERVKGSASSEGMQMHLKMTGTRGLRLTYQTTLILEVPDGDRFVYDLGALGSREGFNALADSMIWENGYTFSFKHGLKNKQVMISHTNGLWSLTEELR